MDDVRERQERLDAARREYDLARASGCARRIVEARRVLERARVDRRLAAPRPGRIALEGVPVC
jgi:hypothetical protein